MALINEYSEEVRQCYLEAMGIQVWFPNREFPRAKVARNIISRVHKTNINELQKQKKMFVSHENPVQYNAPVSINTQVGNKGGRLQALEMVKSFGFSSEDTGQQKLVGSEDQQDQVPVSPFSFVVLGVADSVLIMIELPIMNLKEGVTVQHRHFLSDVLWMLGYSEVILSYIEGQQFIWPFGWPNNERGLLAHMSQGEQAAREAVQAYLEHQFYLSSKTALLIFGKTIAKYVVSSEVPLEKGGWYMRNKKQSVLVSHSVDELMTVPGLKKELWQDINHTVPYEKG